MSTEFFLGLTSIAIERDPTGLVHATVYTRADLDAEPLAVLNLKVPVTACEVGTGFDPWAPEQPTLRLGCAVIPLGDDADVALAMRALGWLQ